MLIIKLNATESTNDYLKELNKHKTLENFTVVSTYQQTNGKGQMGAKWSSEGGKNLTFSVLYNSESNKIESIFDVNIAVSMAIIQVLETFKIPCLKIKWPNDILAENKKIAGILIENSIKSATAITSVIGIGINVNQEVFPEIIQASSLKNITHLEYDLDQLLQKIANKVVENLENLAVKKEQYWQLYHQYLFNRNVPMVFENQEKQRFMGIIKEVDFDGKLRVQLEDDTTESFGLKQIKMLY
jgi:BirA family biotin operon repressor/biotin-[acetyl-CoA-carboxylase] ligase